MARVARMRRMRLASVRSSVARAQRAVPAAGAIVAQGGVGAGRGRNCRRKPPARL